MKVKVSFGSDTRIWRSQNQTFAALRNFVDRSFEQLNDDFLLTYSDDEGDRVTITDDEGLEEAIECTEEQSLRSLKIKVIMTKHAQRIDEPGAIEVEPVKREEIVSEPGTGSTENVNNEEEVDALDVDFLTNDTPDTVENVVNEEQIEGAQSIQTWLSAFLPLLQEHGIADEIKAGIPIFFSSIDAGDDLGTALQTMIAQCHLLQQQNVMQEFMNHVQHNVAPLSDEIVPHILTIGESGLVKMVNKLCAVSEQWANGFSELKFDVTPFLRMIWPAFLKKLEAGSKNMDINLSSIRLPCCRKRAIPAPVSPEKAEVQKEQEEVFAMSTPYEPEESTKETRESRFRLVKEDDWEHDSRRDWKEVGGRNGRWRRGRRSHRRGGRPGSYHSHRKRRDRRSPPRSHQDYWGPPPQHSMPPSHPTFFGSQSTPYYTTGYEDDIYKSMSWDPATKVHVHPHHHHRGPPPLRPSPIRHSAEHRYDSYQRRSANRLEAQQPEVRISATPLKADFINHVNIPLRSKYLPGQKLLKKWCVRNVGRDAWDDRVHLEFTKGDDKLPTKTQFDVPNCASGNLCELSAMIMTPDTPGRYVSYFRLVRNSPDGQGKKVFFGPRIWVDVHVVETEDELANDEEQTQKRLDRIENRQSVQRSSATRNSAKRSNLRSTARKSKTKKKDDNMHHRGGIGMVGFPVSRPLNHNAGSFVPLSSSENQLSKKVSPYESLIEEIHNMGFHSGDDELTSLLDAHNGDVSRVVGVLVERCKEAQI